MRKVKLDIDLISEDLYDELLGAFKEQYGDDIYENWEITAQKEGGN